MYGLFSPDEKEVLGGAGLHTRVGDGALEIGYWIRQSAIGNGLATEATAALTRAAFGAGSERVEIHVDPANEASCRIPRTLGYVEEARLRRRLVAVVPGEPRHDALIFSMLSEEFPHSEASVRSAAVVVFDGAGRRTI